MRDETKTKEQLLDELVESRRRVAELEGIDVERRRSEEALRQSEERYRLLVEAVPESLWRADASGAVVEFNRRWYEYTGQTPEEARGNGWSDVLHPDDVAITAQRVRAAVDAGENVQIEHRVRRASDGGYRWHLARALPMKDRDGKVTGWFGSVTDIDDQKRTEEELGTNRALLRATIDNLPFDFFAIGMDGRYVMQNAVLRANWGQLLGKTPEEVCPDEDTRCLWLDNNRRAFAGEQVEEDVTFTVRGEKRFYHNVVVPVIDAGQIQGILGMNVDITERKRAEAALRESEQRYRTLTESTRDIIYIVDREGTALYANQTASAYTGLNTTDIVGKRQADLFPPEMAATHVARVEQVFETGEVFEEDELFHFGPEEVWLRIHLVPLRDDAGQITSVMGVCHNITDRKRAEAALKRAHDELEEKVRERTAELTKANEELRREVEKRKRAEQELAVFQQFAEASGRGFGMIDLTGRIVYVNPAFCRLLDEEKPEDLVGKHASVWHPQGYERQFEEEIKPVLIQGRHWEGEQILSTRQGRVIPTLYNVFLIRDEQGQPYRLGAAVLDLTERKAAEEALRQSIEELRALYDGMSEGLWILDGETKRPIRVNSSLCRMLGYAEEELLSMSVTDIHPPDDAVCTLARIQARADGRFQEDTNVPLLRKDGSVFYADIMGNTLTYGGRPCVLGLFRDITERRQAAEALAESEAKYRHLVETTDTGYLILEASGRVVDANDEYVRISGHHALEAILGRSVVEWTAPYDVDRNAKEVEKCVERGYVRELEIDYVRPDGRVTPVEINASCLDTKQGRRILSLCQDISERRQAHEALVRERRTLKHMLRASDHERQLIAYDIHDGLAQQLAGAVMQFEVFNHLREARPKQASDAYYAAMTLLRQGHGEARRLISGVRPPILDESGVVAAIAHLVSDQSFKGGSHVVFHSGVEFARLTPILEDVIYRIVQEGLTNAARHSRSEMVRVNLRQRGDTIRIEIRDWGVGFDPKTVPGDRFGLAGIRERARLLGGKCRIQSQLGKGTTILIELPIAEREEK